MTTRSITALLIATSVVLGSGETVIAQTGQQRGATLGGLAGAIAGGLIGDNNNEAGAGAAIGGVVGAVAGGILGNASDKDAAIRRQQQAYYNAQRQQYYAQQQAVAVQSAVTLQDVISMSRSGLSDQVITNQVRQRGYVGKLAVSEIIALHQQGVSENVITTLQAIGNGQVTVARPAPVVNTPVYTPPTVIEQHIHRPAPVIVEQRVLPHYPRPHYRNAGRRGYFYFH